MTKALTVRQPHASLIAVGAKTIETRSWTTSYRGPLIIHSGRAEPSGDVRIGNWLMTLRPRIEIEGVGVHEAKWLLGDLLDDDDNERLFPVSFGAVVASCVLADVVPINTSGAEADWPCITVGPAESPTWALHYGRASEGIRSVTDQLPFGDFTPGRYAWLLEDVKPTTEPIPCRGRQGLWTLPPEIEERLR